MKLLRNYVAVDEVIEEKKSLHGIVMSGEVDYGVLMSSKVVGVGSEVTEVKEGDVVLYMPRTGCKLPHDTGTYRFLKETDLVAIL